MMLAILNPDWLSSDRLSLAFLILNIKSRLLSKTGWQFFLRSEAEDDDIS